MHECDLLIITAANAAQARQYRAQLAARRDRGPIALVRRWLVLPDPRGSRVGSGAATILALVEAAKLLAPKARHLEDAFAHQRILILHSGGDSRRLPAFCARGKLFVPTPCVTRRGTPADLFDLVLEDMLSLSWPSQGRVIVAAGDLLLNASRHSPRLDAPGVVGLACPGDQARASRHGVYVAAAKKDGPVRVTDFLQKPDAATLLARGGIDAAGECAIDTGVLSLDPAAAACWLAASGVSCGPKGLSLRRGGLADQAQTATNAPMDLYVHCIMAMTPRISESQFAATIDPKAAKPARQALMSFRDVVRKKKIALSVTNVPCDFVHVGTTREFMRAALAPEVFGAIVPSRTDPRLIACDDARVRITAPENAIVVVEGARRSLRLRACGDALVAGVADFAKLDLPASCGVTAIPLKDNQWASVAFGLDDDCKTTMERGGTFAGFMLQDLPSCLRMDAAEIWGEAAERSLWTAALWRSGPLATVLRDAEILLAGRRPAQGWAKAQRFSLADVMKLAKVGQTARNELPWSQVASAIEAGARPDIAALAAQARRARKAKALSRDLVRVIERQPHPFAAARAMRLQRQLMARRGPETDDALGAIRVGVESAYPIPSRPWDWKRGAKGEVRVSSPVRIDLAGGWSDTPPICHEQGGSVVNMAILLEGRAPVSAAVKRIPQSLVRIASQDLGRSEEYATAAAIGSYSDPDSFGALAKAALVLAGMVPSDPAEDLKAWLGPAGGIEVMLDVAVPKGSGLGTSSILGATLIRALDKFAGRDEDTASVIRRTSVLEQMMSTGGGWQDQCGGLVPGVKSATSMPGSDQVPRIERLKLGERCRGMLEERGVLVFTGVRRLAKNILRNVVYRYLDGGNECQDIVRDLRSGAAAMRRAILDDHEEAFCDCLAEYWRLKTRIDPGACDARVKRLIAPLAKYASAWELPGAGGGGFAFLIAKSTRDAARMKRAGLEVYRWGISEP